ncbi:MAG TPA: helix-turn-helix transcriptional regulator [Dongiaceae bacterium]|jgi:transcriptional regulator with XRE-family HTH domain|nr:helix-turn-helix transcriptional regulator [Dongiaceae bacterium]
MTFHARVGRHAEYLAALDIYIGQRLRMRRKALGFSQERLGRELGLTFQQVQKYENGTNSLSTRRLYQLTEILNVPITFFFDGYAKQGPSKPHVADSDDLNLALVRACERIASPEIKAALKALIKTIARAEPLRRLIASNKH